MMGANRQEARGNRMRVTTARKRKRTPKPPNYTAEPAERFPLPDQPAAWAHVPWAAVRRQLDEGKAIGFAIEHGAVLGFWKYALAMVGRPIIVRYKIKRQVLSIMRAPWCGTVGHQAGRRERLRLYATVLHILADADEFRERMEMDQAEADTVFAANRGADRYPVAFDLETLRRWRDEVGKNGIPNLRLRYTGAEPGAHTKVPMKTNAPHGWHPQPDTGVQSDNEQFNTQEETQ